MFTNKTLHIFIVKKEMYSIKCYCVHITITNFFNVDNNGNLLAKLL